MQRKILYWCRINKKEKLHINTTRIAVSSGISDAAVGKKAGENHREQN